MHNIIFPSKDSTIYSKFPEINTGLDEILEVTKEVSSSNYFFRGIWNNSTFYKRFDYVSGSDGEYLSLAENINQATSSAFWTKFESSSSLKENSRILIKFDLNNFNAEATASASVVYLNLFASIAKKVPIEYALEARPISGSWEMGVGNYTDKSTHSGVTWNNRDSVTLWTNSGSDNLISTTASQNFNFSSADVRMDVTNIFADWTSSVYPNEGFLIKRIDSQENDNIKYGSLSFYSMDTHTIYLPTLEIAYDNHIYDTSDFYPLNASGSVSASLISGSINIYTKNLMKEYKYNSNVRFNLIIKDAYQIKTFYEEARIGEIKYVSDDLYYSIIDAYSNRTMIPFSDYTKVSIGATGYYFDTSLSGFMPERFYKIIFKYVKNGNEQYFDTDNKFKVTKQ